MEIVCWSLLVVIAVGLICSAGSTYGFSLEKEEDVDRIFNVMDYGAVGFPDTDNSWAFLEAWNAACNAEAATFPTVLIPENVAFLVSSTHFKGPCRAQDINFKILGTIMAPNSPKAWSGKDSSQWLVFEGVNGLLIDGLTGTIYGQGYDWWNQSCRISHGQPGCTNLAPTALKLISCNNSILKDIYLADSPQTHVAIMYSNGININNLRIESPEISPNTDGIHIHASNNLSISNINIKSGDDCISIGDYTSNINISYIECGPGHGISIGSLGGGGNFVQVEDIHVSDSTFIGTTNGARIKTWQVGKGYVRNVTFENLIMQAVENSIIIDQNYCDRRGACRERDTGVHISEVVYKGVIGTSKSDIAINLNCSRAVPCTGITMMGIQISSSIVGKEVIASCNNAHGQEIGLVVPSHCLINGVSGLLHYQHPINYSAIEKYNT